MPAFYDPSRALHENWRDFFLQNCDEWFTFPTIEGNIEIQGKWLHLNIMICMPIIMRGHPISSKNHMIIDKIYGAGIHAEVSTRIVRYLEDLGYPRNTLGHDVMSTHMAAHNMCYTHLGSYVGTMDIFSIADTVLQEEMIEATNMDYGDIDDKNIKRMETLFRERSEQVVQLLRTDKLKHNCFRGSLLVGALKEKQFHQSLISAGPRSDTDERIFLRPVEGSFLSGMFNILDYIIESRSAAKAKQANAQQMSTASYASRKNHIQASVMRYLYPGDCGSNVFIDYHPSKKTIKFLSGRFYKTEDGSLREITEDIYEKLVGMTLELRDPHGCRYTDGVCEVCAGTISKSLPREGNLGFIANSKTGSPITQAVLSTKHLVSTDAVEYVIPVKVSGFLVAKHNDIFLGADAIAQAKIRVIGFAVKDIKKLNDLKYSANSQRPSSYYSNIMNFYIGDLDENGNVTKVRSKTAMKDSRIVSYPHLSPELLHVIRTYPEDQIPQDDILWLKLDHVDFTKPIMHCTVMNNSIRNFVDQFRELMTKDIERYTSVNDLMLELCNLIWSRVGAHSTHIAILARSALVTSKSDFSIPVVTDPNNVMYSKQTRIIPMRSVGGIFAFERFRGATMKPGTYIVGKPHGEYDEFMGFTDMIERDANWPPNADRLTEVPFF